MKNVESDQPRFISPFPTKPSGCQQMIELYKLFSLLISSIISSKTLRLDDLRADFSSVKILFS
ncbi:MAG: hypothetical protein H6772_00975 [Pseudomonadales bacterium]|nr:hypothetical protein [Pseudomonadales bacterium]